MSVVIEPSDEQSRRMRDGVRARITGVARQAGTGMLRLTPPALIALLCAGAFAPVVAAAGAGAEIAAGIGVLGSVGAEILGDLVTDTIDRLRGDGRAPDPAAAERDLARRIEETLASGGERAARLQREIAAVLHEIGAARVALETVIETGDRELQQQMTVAFETLGTEFAEFGFLLTDVRDAAESILETLLRSEAERQADSERLRRQSAQLRMIHDEVVLIERRTRSAPPAAAPDGDGTADRAGGPDSAVQAGTAGVASGVVWSGCPYQGLWPFEPEHAAIFYGRERLTAELTGRLAERLTGLGMVIVTGASGAGKSSLLRAGLLPALTRGSLSPAAAGWPQVLLPLTRAPLDELAVQLAALGGTDVAPLRRTLAEHPEQAHLAVRQALLAHRRTFPAPSPPDAYPSEPPLSEPPSSGRPGSPSGAPGSSSSSGSAAAGRERPSAVPTDGVTPSPGKGGTADRLVLVVDQFEKIFAPDTGEAEREAFVTALRAAAGTPCGPEDTPPALVVIGVRGDFWARCADYPQLTEALQDGQFVVGPMTEPELRRAISGPATAAGLELEPGLVDDILAELRRSGTTGGYEAGALPLLSQAMLLTWENREGARLTRRGYGLTGGVAHALRISAEAVYQALPPHRREMAAELFRRLTAITPDGDLARRTAPRADLRAVKATVPPNAGPMPRTGTVQEGEEGPQADAPPTASVPADADAGADAGAGADVAAGVAQDGEAAPGARVVADHDVTPAPRAVPDVDAVLGAFADRRLVILDENTAQIAHDALLSAWPRPGEWVEEDRKGLLIRQRLGAAARDWVESGRDDGLLYRGARLAEAREWADGREDLTAEEELFLRASTAAAEAALTEERHRRRRVTRLAAGLAVLLVVALVAGAVAVQQRATSDRQRAEAESRQWAAESTLAADADPRRAMMFAALAWRTEHTPEARGAVLSAQMLNHAGQLGDNGSIAVAISPDGRFVATGGANGEVGLWDARTHRLVTRLRGLTGRTLRLAFSPDGTMLAAGANGPLLPAGGALHPAMVWAVPSGRALQPPPGVPLGSLAWRPDGRALAVGTAGPGRVVIRQWDPRAGRDLGTFTSARAHGTDLRPALPMSIAYSADGSRIAVGHADGTATMFAAGGRTIATLRGHAPKAVVQVAFSPDGTLATGGDRDGNIFFWDTAGRRTGQATAMEHSSINGLAYADAERLFVAGGDTRLRVWNVDTRTWNIGSYVRPTGAGSVAVSADGSTIVGGGPDGPTMVWRRNVVWLAGTDPDAAMADVAFARSGDRIAAVDARGGLYVWDVASRPPTLLLTDHSTAALGLSAVAYAPDGSIAATSMAGAVRLFDARGHRRADLSTGAGLVVDTVAFSPDGSLLAAGAQEPPGAVSDDQNAVYIWDARDLRQPPVVLPLQAQEPDRIVFTSDGSRMLAITTETPGGSNSLLSRVREWRLPGFTGGRTLETQGGQLVGIAPSHDGRTLAVVGTRGVIELWDLRRDRFLRQFGGQVSALRDVAFSVDDRVIATGAQHDSVVRLWDVATGGLLATLTGHLGPLNRVTFGPHGDLLATAGTDGTVGLWDTDPAVALRHICAALSGPTLTADWKSLGVAPDTAPCR